MIGANDVAEFADGVNNLRHPHNSEGRFLCISSRIWEKSYAERRCGSRQKLRTISKIPSVDDRKLTNLEAGLG